jgi:hypothetical protein
VAPRAHQPRSKLVSVVVEGRLAIPSAAVAGKP